MDSLKKHAKALAVLAGAAGVLLYIFQKDPNRPVQQGLSKEEKDQLFQGIQVQKVGNIISEMSMIEILEAVVTLMQAEFQALGKKSRTERRMKFDKPKQYVQVCTRYKEELGELVAKYQKKVLKRLNIDEATWKASYEYHLRQGNPLNLYIKTMLVMKKETKQMLSSEQIKQVLRAKILTAKTKSHVIKEYASHALSPDVVKMIIHNFVTDSIFMDLGVEDDDFVISFTRQKQDEEAKQLEAEYEQYTQTLLAMLVKKEV